MFRGRFEIELYRKFEINDLKSHPYELFHSNERYGEEKTPKVVYFSGLDQILDGIAIGNVSARCVVSMMLHKQPSKAYRNSWDMRCFSASIVFFPH